MQTWSIFWRLTRAAVAVTLLRFGAGFTLQQSIALVIIAIYVLEVARENRLTRLRIRVQPHWQTIRELLGADVEQSTAAGREDVAYSSVTLTQLEHNLWFNSQTGLFSSSPAFSQIIPMSWDLLGELHFGGRWSQTGLSFFLSLPFRPTTENEKVTVRNVVEAGFLVADSGDAVVATLPYEAIRLAAQDVTLWGWIFFGRSTEQKLRSTIERYGWKAHESRGWESRLVSVSVTAL